MRRQPKNGSSSRSECFLLQGDDGQFDPQTEADRASQKCIIGSLLKMYPTLQIIGEEEVCYKNITKFQC